MKITKELVNKLNKKKQDIIGAYKIYKIYKIKEEYFKVNIK